MDASYVQELDGILKEARTLENHLKQKRESLKQRFTVIANSLQSWMESVRLQKYRAKLCKNHGECDNECFINIFCKYF